MALRLGDGAAEVRQPGLQVDGGLPGGQLAPFGDVPVLQVRQPARVGAEPFRLLGPGLHGGEHGGVLLPRRPDGRLQLGALGGQLTQRLPQAGDLRPEPFGLLGGLRGGHPVPGRSELPAGVADRLPGVGEPLGGLGDPAAGLVDPGRAPGQRGGETAGHPDPRGLIDRRAAARPARPPGQAGQEPVQREPAVGAAGQARRGRWGSGGSRGRE